MYENYKFVEEQTYQAKNVKSALEICEARKYSMDTFKGSEIGIKEDGSFMLKNEQFKATSSAFERFCALLGIPRPFARKIPEELLSENINTLIKEKKDKEFYFYRAKKPNGIIGVSKAGLAPFNNTDMLTQLNTLKLDDKDVTFKEIEITDKGVAVIVQSAMERTIEVVKGDILNIGILIKNSDTGYGGAVAKLLVERIICTNGATLTGSWGSVRGSSMKKIKAETRLASFVSGVGSLQVNMEKLKHCYQKMNEEDLTDEYFKRYWGGVHKIFGDDGSKTDKLFKITEEQRKNAFKEVSARKKQGRMMQDIDEPGEMGVTWYEAYNMITSVEKDFTGEDRFKLLRLGGTMPQAFFQNFICKN